MQRCGTCSFYFTARLLGVLFAKEAPFIYCHIFIKTRISGYQSFTALRGSQSLSRVCVCVQLWVVCVCTPACSTCTSVLVEASFRMTKRRVRGAWRVAFECAGKYAAEKAHQPGPRAARAWLVSCDREASRNFNRPGGGRTLLRTGSPACSKLQESRYAPQTSSKSNRHPVPAVQPSSSSVAVQSLAPAAWQMASASAKVLSRVHGQPASDSPHTEQSGRRDPHAIESLTSEQHRT